MLKNLMLASLVALALTACNKSDDKSAGGSPPPAGLSQLGGHSGPNNK